MDDKALNNVDELVKLINIIIRSSIQIDDERVEDINKSAIQLITPINNLLEMTDSTCRLERRINGTIVRTVNHTPSFQPPHNADMEIIVAEDNPIDQRMMLEVLTTIGYTNVRLASTGFEVLNLVELKMPRVILLDLSMPVLNGFETMKLLTEKHPLDTPVVIAVSGSILQRSKNRCFEVGMSAFIAKPVNIEELNTLLRLI